MAAPVVFDKRALCLHRERAARHGPGNFLFAEVAQRLAERLLEVNRSFPRAVDLSGHGNLARTLHDSGAAGRRGIRTCIAAALSPRLVQPDALALVADEQALPFAPRGADLILSVLGLHWTDDLPGALLQARQALRPDGLFLAALFGGETLAELRTAFAVAEAEIEGGAGPRVAPFVDVRDAGALLQRAGFALPVSDVDTIVATYATPFDLMRDLRAMGETNALAQRRRNFSRRETFARCAEVMAERFARDGRIRATFQVVYLTGWAPHPSQQKPLPRGSAKVRLSDALEGARAPGGKDSSRQR